MAARSFVALSDNFPDDDRIIEVSPLARLVFVYGICIAHRNESDGRLTLGQLRRSCADFGDLAPLLDELVRIGLVALNDDVRTKSSRICAGTHRTRTSRLAANISPNSAAEVVAPSEATRLAHRLPIRLAHR